VFALVDAYIFDELSKVLWGLSSRGYVFFRRRKQKTNVYLHHVALGLPNGQEIDHINRDKLDNRQVNLRPVTRAQNTQNTEFRPNRTGYLGVRPNGSGKFVARINADGERLYLGQFDSAEAAARAYDEAALRLRGAFAQLNFPSEHSTCN